MTSRHNPPLASAAWLHVEAVCVCVVWGSLNAGSSTRCRVVLGNMDSCRRAGACEELWRVNISIRSHAKYWKTWHFFSESKFKSCYFSRTKVKKSPKHLSYNNKKQKKTTHSHITTHNQSIIIVSVNQVSDLQQYAGQTCSNWYNSIWFLLTVFG